MAPRRVNVAVAAFIYRAGRGLNAQRRWSTGLRRQDLPLQEAVEPVAEGHDHIFAFQKVEAGLRYSQNFSSRHESKIPVVAGDKTERVPERRADAAVGPSAGITDGQRELDRALPSRGPVAPDNPVGIGDSSSKDNQILLDRKKKGGAVIL